MKSKKTSPDEKNSDQSKNFSPNCDVKASVKFERESKRLHKKYTSLANEIEELRKELRTNPTKGVSIGHSCYKIRLAIKSKGKGKSGGARVITYYYIYGNTVYLLSIYDKAVQENISEKTVVDALLEMRETENTKHQPEQ